MRLRYQDLYQLTIKQAFLRLIPTWIWILLMLLYAMNRWDLLAWFRGAVQ